MTNLAHSPPENDCARTSAVKAVLGLTVLVFSSNRCSPRTFLQRPYRKLCRMSDVMMSDRARVCCLNPAFRTRASAGNTEPMMKPVTNIPAIKPDSIPLAVKCKTNIYVVKGECNRWISLRPMWCQYALFLICVERMFRLSKVPVGFICVRSDPR